MKCFIIEHTSRGILTDKSEPSLGIWKFQWSKSRSDQGNMFIHTREHGNRLLNQMPPLLRDRSELREIEI